MDFPISLSSQTVDQLKSTIKILERVRWVSIKVARKDGKKGSPLKADYVVAIERFLASLPKLPELTTDVLLFIFSMDFFPRKFCLLSREMNQAANSESFYRQVCTFRGYTLQDNCRDFFLRNVDVSKVIGTAFQPFTSGSLCISVDCDGFLTSDGTYVVTPGTTYRMPGPNLSPGTVITKGQLRHILEEFYSGFTVDVPEDAWKILDAKPCTDAISHRDCCKFRAKSGGWGRDTQRLMEYGYCQKPK